ncbi:MAG: alanine racemase [Butyricicoccus sp.]|nr:alanine racemase [Butyricicoccus sp.]
MQQNKHRTWAEIDLSAIEHNFRVIQEYVGDYPVMAIIKADAYGHGSVRVAERLAAAGAARFAVATVSEAIELREQGVKLPILILGYVGDEDARLIARYDISVPVYDRETAQVFSLAAQQEGSPIRVHFALDTGMTRIGFAARHVQETVDEIIRLAELPGLIAEGMFTHFAVADTLDGQAFTQQQMEEFRAVADGLERSGLHIPVKHCANSGGVLQYKDGYFDMVRAGIILYGYYPDPSLPHVLDLRPAMTLKARVVQVRNVEPGRTVSYGRTYEVTRPIQQAVLSIGYADGYLRAASGHAHVLVDGKQAPVLGRICMDMCMIEVPEGAKIKRGDEVVVFGPGAITADDVAQAAGTISYEVLCATSARVPRIYFG